MKKVIKKLLSLFICKSYDLYFGAMEFVKVRILQRHKIVFYDSIVKKITSDQRKLAIIAIRPNGITDQLTVNLLRSLRLCNYYVVVVSNSILNQHQKDLFLSSSDRVIERAAVGRDFGSYQLGLKKLGILDRKKHTQFKKVLIANDSLFWRKDTNQIIQDMENINAPWMSLFENYQHHYHMQSFFLMFDEVIFKSKQFIDYWHKYKPYSTRTHSINKGEVGLSLCLLKAGFIPFSYFNSNLVRNITKLDLFRRVEVFQLLPNDSEISWKNFSCELMKFLDVRKNNLTDTRDNALSDLFWSDFTNTVSTLAESKNTTHFLGIILNKYANAPLKRDISFRGTFGISQVLDSISGFSKDEMEMINQDLRLKGFSGQIKKNSIKYFLLISGRI